MLFSSHYMFSKRNGLQWITGAKFPTYNWDWGNRLTKQRQNSPGRIWMQLGWIHARRYGHAYSRDFLCQWHIYNNSVIGSSLQCEIWTDVVDVLVTCAQVSEHVKWLLWLVDKPIHPHPRPGKGSFWEMTQNFIGWTARWISWMMAKLEGLEVSQPLQFGVGNPPANSLMVSVGSVGHGYGKDTVSDIAGARIRPCWCQVCTAPWAVKLAQILCPRVLFLVIRSGMTVLGQYFVATVVGSDMVYSSGGKYNLPCF